MILKWGEIFGKKRPLDIRCDVCSVVFDDTKEIDEFICFDFITGEGSTLSKGIHIKFDVCQDCFQDAFQDTFLKMTDINFQDDSLMTEGIPETTDVFSNEEIIKE